VARDAGILDLLKQFRRAKYDLVIDMHARCVSAFFALISGARVRIGFDRPIKTDTLQFPPSTISKMYPAMAGRRARGSWIATRIASHSTLDVHAIDRYLWSKLLGFDDTARSNNSSFFGNRT